MATFSTATTFFPSMFATMLLTGLLMVSPQFAGAQPPVGVCYGGLGSDLPPPQQVVDLYKVNNIRKMRIYQPDQSTFEALKGSGIEVIQDVPRDNLQQLAEDKSAAANWVEQNIRKYSPDVKFKYIAVGNEVIPNNSNDYILAKFVLPAMQNIQEAISSAGLQNQIKVTTAVFPGVLATYDFSRPSQGSFNSEASNYMGPIVNFLASTGSPFLINVYPYFSYVGNPAIDIGYALFTNNSVVQDGQLQYQNLFDAMVDAHYAALEKVSGSGVDIVVSESGWPSDGGKDATIPNAQTYNSNLIKHVSQGTPKRRGKAIETYIFAMFNENLKTGAETEKHFGLFYPSKQPVYQVNFN